MNGTVWDVAVIGAGAAGLMAAITAQREGLKVLLLDGKEKIGAKILMSGGTRCNVTNDRVSENDYESENLRFVKHVLSAFTSEKAIRFFDDLNVKLVLELGGKYFPETHSAKTVLDALLKEAKRLGIELKAGQKITAAKFNSGYFTISGPKFSYQAKNIVLCTGGLSYPSSGSDGTGYEIAKSFGHTLIETTPALTPLLTDDRNWKSLSGITLNAELTLWLNAKKHKTFRDSFLFTHFGFSGPSALNISRYWVRNQKSAKLTANFLPEIKEDDFENKLMEAAKSNPAKLFRNFLSENFPDRFADVIIKKAGIPESVKLNQLTRENRASLIKTIFSSHLSITGVYGYQKAEVTAGGINLDEVDSKTLESKLQKGLFFAGEILDVDGRIGGFNFQWAWSSGTVAARAISATTVRSEAE